MPRYLVVDVGGTKILAAAVNAEGEILARHKVKTNRASRAALLAQLDDALNEVCAQAKLSKSAIAGVGVGVPGVVDSARGYVVLTPNAPLSDTPLGPILSEKWNCPILVGNDGNLGIAGELWRGAARGASSAFGIFVGTGIGGGLFLNGQLIEGFRGLSGEIGHFMLPAGADGILGAITKKHLLLEELCSRTAIETQLRHALKEGRKSVLTELLAEKKSDRIRSGALKEALRREDALVIETINRASYLLGLAAANVLHLIDPQIIVFGGGVIEACGPWMMPQIEKSLKKVAMPGTGAPVQLVESQLGDDAILMGGLSLLLSGKARAPERIEVFASVDKPLKKN